MTRIMGIDLGERRIGIAVGDTVTGSARGLAVVIRSDPARDRDKLAAIVDDQAIDEVVLSLPRNTDGSEGPQAAATSAWAIAVLQGLGLPSSFRDEALSSQAAEANLGRARRGRSGGPPSAAARDRRRGAIDREAARIILQAEIDARRRVRP